MLSPNHGYGKLLKLLKLAFLLIKACHVNYIDIFEVSSKSGFRKWSTCLEQNFDVGKCNYYPSTYLKFSKK